jgi:predicted naringenin-chalcone synthase
MFKPPEFRQSGSRIDPKIEAIQNKPEFATDVAMEDWELLLDAVKSRLRAVAVEPSIAAELTHNPAFDRVRIHVLECMGALDQLHETVRHELVRNRSSGNR